MKMRELCESTGVSKRNVHFYISEGLLAPSQDAQNGYYHFSEEDKRRLLMIRSLRDGGFSIAQIRAILQAPSTSVYYMNQRLKQIRRERAYLAQLEEAVSYMQQNLSIHPGFSDLEKLVQKASIPSAPEAKDLSGDAEETDTALVNRYLWEGFLPDAPMSDYQEFLWSRINRYSGNEYEEDYRLISRTLRSFSDAQIRSYFSDNRQMHEEVICLNPAGYAEYADRMKAAIKSFLEKPEEVRRWKELYRGLLAPSVRLYDSDMAKTMEELSPAFSVYRVNVNAVCRMVYDWLHTSEGARLLDKMANTLGDFFDIDNCSHGQLQGMATYL